MGDRDKPVDVLKKRNTQMSTNAWEQQEEEQWADLVKAVVDFWIDKGSEDLRGCVSTEKRFCRGGGD